MKNLTKLYLESILFYNPTTGIFIWKEREGNKWFNTNFAGKQAGYNDNSYIKIRICGKQHYAHRIAYLMFYGYLPNVVDHNDGNPSNNAISNLNNGTQRNNCTNRPISTLNKSGQVGVFYDERIKRWIAQIYSEKGIVYLGCFKEKEDAIKKRKDSEIIYGYNKNHGRKPLKKI